MRRALALLLLALVPLSVAATGPFIPETVPPPDWAVETTFTYHRYSTINSEGGSVIAYFEVQLYEHTSPAGTYGGAYRYTVAGQESGVNCGITTHAAFSVLSPGARDSLLNGKWADYVTRARDCLALDPWDAPPSEPPVGDPGGYECQDFPTLGATWCHDHHEAEDPADDTYDVTWVTKCGGTFSETGLTRVEFEAAIDAFEAAVDAPCDVYEPTPPDDPEVACTGTDGIACESTLQDIREILGTMLAREQEQEQEPALPFPDETTENFTAPFFDQSAPSFEGFVEPDVPDSDLSDMLARVDAAWDDLRVVAETRYPFGMAGWLPAITVGAAPACVDFDFTILGVSEPLGWCASGPYAFLTGAGRAALLFMVTLAFVFAVMRTVAWA